MAEPVPLLIRRSPAILAWFMSIAGLSLNIQLWRLRGR